MSHLITCLLGEILGIIHEVLMHLKKSEDSTAVIAERLLVLAASVPTYYRRRFLFV